MFYFSSIVWSSVAVTRRFATTSSTESLRPVCAIVGGTKGIGLAIGREWLKKYRSKKPKLYLLGRTTENNRGIDNLISEFGTNSATIKPVSVDLTNPSSIEKAVENISSDTKHLDYLIHTAGHLHNMDETGKQIDSLPVLPERSMRGWELEGMIQTFTMNTFAPALVIKNFSSLLKQGGKIGYRIKCESKPPVVAALSARVSSLADNRKGGWTSYRASKAALNMILLNAHHEFRDNVIVLSLHPGTVDTALSKPFQDAAKKQYEIFTPEFSAEKLFQICYESDIQQSGKFIAWDGKEIPW